MLFLRPNLLIQKPIPPPPPLTVNIGLLQVTCRKIYIATTLNVILGSQKGDNIEASMLVSFK